MGVLAATPSSAYLYDRKILFITLLRRAFPKIPFKSISGQYLAQLRAAVMMSSTHRSQQLHLAGRSTVAVPFTAGP